MNTKKREIPPYYNFPRPEIQALVPHTAKDILDLGCASGRLGAELKKRQNCKVYGVDINPEMLKHAKKRLDDVRLSNIDFFEWEKIPSKWDCIILGDILEHLINPWRIIAKAEEYLKPGGTIIASIPNIAHPRIVQLLQLGLFRYEPAGICDSDHKRFFTRTSITQMFSQADLKITHLSPQPSPEDPSAFLISAQKVKRKHKEPKVTIIILNSGQFNYLFACIKSIRKNTECPYKIIVVDNGSKDGTIDWLRREEDILTIENQQNLGFPIGNNLAMSMLDTPYFCLLNNDTLVTKGWLKRLVQIIESQDIIKIVGPTSNYVSGPQQDKSQYYKTISDMEKHAAKVHSKPYNLIQESPRIVFFCTLLKTELIRTIGLLDERFSPGNFEDDDYCLRVIQAGGKCAIARSVFIHHYGEIYWKGRPEEFRDLMIRNQKKFKEKWHL